MKCDKCKYFKIACKPMMPFEQGLAICEKHNLEADFTDARKLNRLTCVEVESNDS
jgi:hypothetical protein